MARNLEKTRSFPALAVCLLAAGCGVPPPESPPDVGQAAQLVLLGCTAQDAAGDNLCRATLGYFYWDGGKCVEAFGCNCTGTQCGSTFPTQAACESGYSACLAGAVSCDASRVTCRSAPPQCPAGEVPSLRVTNAGGQGCWSGSCVPLGQCACDSPGTTSQCPGTDAVCLGTTGRCGPFVR